MAMRFNWGTGITLVYITFALGTLGMVGLAVSRPAELVSEDYYGQSLTYDRRLAAVERADALGRALAVDVDAQARALVVHVPADAADEARGRVTFYRPSMVTADRTVALVLDQAGEARLPIGDLAAGVWHVRLDWESRGRSFYREQRIVLP